MKDYYKLAIVFAVAIMSVIIAVNVSANLGTFEQGKCMEIRTISNSTQVNLSSIEFPNNTLIYPNKAMTQQGKTFNFTFCGTDTIGNYVYDFNDKEGNTFVNDFDVSYKGDKLDGPKVTLYTVMLGIMVLFWFLMLFYTTKLPSGNTEVDDDGLMQISKLKYLRHTLFGVLWITTIIILFLSSNLSLAYLQFEMFATLLFALFQLMMWLSIPAIFLWFAWIFWTLTTDKKIERYLKMGMGPGGRL